MNPKDYKNKQFGKALAFDVVKDKREEYAEIFSEGSQTLKVLLLYLWDRDIETIACCAGHRMKPFYVKKTLLGEKYVSEAEFLQNKSNKKYRRFISDVPGYLAFKLKEGEDSRTISEKIKKTLTGSCPDVPCHITFGISDIGIYMDYAASEQNTERFFQEALTAINAATSKQNKQ